MVRVAVHRVRVVVRVRFGFGFSVRNRVTVLRLGKGWVYELWLELPFLGLGLG